MAELSQRLFTYFIFWNAVSAVGTAVAPCLLPALVMLLGFGSVWSGLLGSFVPPGVSLDVLCFWLHIFC